MISLPENGHDVSLDEHWDGLAHLKTALGVTWLVFMIPLREAYKEFLFLCEIYRNLTAGYATIAGSTHILLI